jgi:hypothetical protein
MSAPISSDSLSPQQEKQEQKQEQNPEQKQKEKERAVNPRAIRPDNLAVSFTKENIKITKMRKLFGF